MVSNNLIASVRNLSSQLRDLFEPDFGLLDELCCLDVLSDEQVDEVRNIPSVFKQCDAIMKHVVESEIACKNFISALSNTAQQHVANFIEHCGEIPPSAGDVRPLESSILTRIKKATTQLVECFDASLELLIELTAAGCLTRLHQEYIEAGETSAVRNRRLLNVIKRRSLADYKTFVRYVEKHQSHLVTLFTKDTVVAVLDAELDPFAVTDVDRAEENIVEQFKSFLIQCSDSDRDQLINDINELLNRKFNNDIRLISISKRNSLMMYFVCESVRALIRLADMFRTRCLIDSLEELFSKLNRQEFGSSDVTISSLKWTENNYNRCRRYFQPPYDGTRNLLPWDGIVTASHHHHAQPATTLDRLPIEMLEMILLRVVSRMFTVQLRQQPRCCDAFNDAILLILTSLTKVCRRWHFTIAGWPNSNTRKWFKHRVRHYLTFKKSSSAKVARVVHPPTPTDSSRSLSTENESNAIASCPSVGGLAVLDDQLYVVRQSFQKQSPSIEIYSTSSMQLIGSVAIDRRSSLVSYGLVVCRTSDDDTTILFFTDFHSSLMHQVELSTSKFESAHQKSHPLVSLMTSWPVASHPVGLSVIHTGDLLVTCSWANVIQLYTGPSTGTSQQAGTLIREIPFNHYNRLNPEYTVEVTLGTGSGRLYAVSHKGPVNGGVCLINPADGTVVASYGRKNGMEPRCNPRGLTFAARSGCLLVSDFENCCVLIIDLASGSAKTLAALDEAVIGVFRPQTLYLDENSGNLYVGEHTGQGRFLVVENINYCLGS